MPGPGTTTIFSIGHSNHPAEKFLGLLRQHEIQLLADVRSVPWSRFASQHNREALARALPAAGVAYLYLGAELGGRPEGTEFYDAEGHVLYAKLAASERFLEGIERLLEAAAQQRVAIMCAEENPARCHRTLLIAPVLTGRGVELRHIRGDGRVDAAVELARSEPSQISLFSELHGPK